MGDFLRSSRRTNSNHRKQKENWRIRGKNWMSGSHRMWVLWAIVILLLILLAIRLTSLYGVESDKLIREGEKRYLRQHIDKAARGTIEDRLNKPLAVSVPVNTMWADLAVLHEAGEQNLKDIIAILEADEKRVTDKMREKTEGTILIKRNVDDKTVDLIKQKKLAGVYPTRDYQRLYPQGDTVSQVVGLVGQEGQGQDGLEYSFDKSLTGQDGIRRVMVDRLGRVVEELGIVQEMKPGEPLRLTIDMRVQYPVSQTLKAAIKHFGAKAGTVVVMDAQEGDVLAMVNLPTFIPGQKIQSPEQLQNRAVTDVFEPGSSFKPFTVALALDKGTVKLTSRFDTAPGFFKIGDKTIRDAEEHGVLDVGQIIQKSSNIGSSKVAFTLDPKTMWQMFTSLGFGKTPKIGTPGTAAGILMKPERWLPIHQATISYGHGVSVSALQLASGYSVFANKGRLAYPKLNLSIPSSSSEPIFSTKTVKTMMEFLESVTAPGGTGTLSKINIPGYRVAGKTGTSRKLENGKYVRKYVTTFVGLVPASAPKYIIAVIIDEPTKKGFSGGLVSAPVFSEVAQTVLRVYNVPPDAPENAISHQPLDMPHIEVPEDN